MKIIAGDGDHEYKMCVVSTAFKLYCWNSVTSSSVAPSTYTIDAPVLQVQVGYYERCIVVAKTTANAATSRVKCNDDGYKKYVSLGGYGQAIKVDGVHNGFCAIMDESSTCASRIVCFQTRSVNWVKSTPTCVDLDDLTGHMGSYDKKMGKKTYTGSSSGVYAVDMTGGWTHVCALLSNDQVACFGSNHNDAIANTPILTKPVAGVYVTSFATCVIYKGDVQPACWGYSSNFQGYTTIAGISGAIGASTNGYYYCFAMADNSVKCTGSDASTRGINFGSSFRLRSPSYTPPTP
jgi:hypothetical protein